MTRSGPTRRLTTIVINWALARLERTQAWLGRQSEHPSVPPVASDRGSAARASLVILNWRRPDNVRTLLDRYVTFGSVDDIIVWNNNGAVPFAYPHAKVRCINSDEFGLTTRWLACLAARHDCVIVHDDDLICDQATIDALIAQHHADPIPTYTLHGRNPTAANEYAEKVDHVAEPCECDIHLTRVTCVNRRWVPRYFEAIAAMGLEIDPARGGGEDIVMSYAARAASGRRPIVVPGRYEDLLAPHGLANRNGSQVSDRTSIMHACQQWLANRR